MKEEHDSVDKFSKCTHILTDVLDINSHGDAHIFF